MTVSSPVRHLVGAALVGSSAAAGVLLGTPLPWTLALAGGVLIAVALLVADVVVFGRPLHRSTPGGRRSLAALGALGVLAALAVSFELGRVVEASRGDQAYVYVAAGVNNGYGNIYSAPVDNAVNDIVEAGDRVSVQCAVSYEGGFWLRLTSGEGWVKTDDFYAAPHTGQGMPPSCPE